MYWLENNHKEGKLMLSLPTSICRKRGLLLIDDDEWFRSLFTLICEAQGIPITTFSSLADMPSFAALKDFDVIILDYYLESFRGPEIAEYIDVFFADLPVLVISGTVIQDDERRNWPSCIRRFQCKADGPHAIIENALSLLTSDWPSSTPKAANLN